MSQLSYEFNEAQRKTLERYTRFLGSLRSIFNNVAVAFEQRQRRGHQPVVLAADSRWNNAFFNGQYLSTLYERVNEINVLFKSELKELAMFTQEALDVTARTGRKEPIEQVNFRLFSLSTSQRWTLSPPAKVEDLIHDFYLRFIGLRSAIRQLVFKFTELSQESFGLKSVFMAAMDHRACHCHTQPSVAQVLFLETVTTPAWDIVYSSREASIRATEYKADITLLFKAFDDLSARMGLLVRDLYQRMEDVVLELRRATYVFRLGELNAKLSAIIQQLNQCMTMLDDFEHWLRK